MAVPYCTDICISCSCGACAKPLAPIRSVAKKSDKSMCGCMDIVLNRYQSIQFGRQWCRCCACDHDIHINSLLPLLAPATISKISRRRWWMAYASYTPMAAQRICCSVGHELDLNGRMTWAFLRINDTAFAGPKSDMCVCLGVWITRALGSMHEPRHIRMRQLRVRSVRTEPAEQAEYDFYTHTHTHVRDRIINAVKFRKNTKQ